MCGSTCAIASRRLNVDVQRMDEWAQLFAVASDTTLLNIHYEEIWIAGFSQTKRDYTRCNRYEETTEGFVLGYESKDTTIISKLRLRSIMFIE